MDSSHSTSTTSNPPQQHSPSRNPPPISSDSTSTQIIDVDEIAISSIREKLSQTSHLPPPSQCSIFKVPDMLRRHNEKAFMPEVVSIGPFHPKNEQLQAMENIKVLYLKCLLDRPETTELENLVKALGRIEQDCRKCYAGVVGLSVENFIEMMVIDGCFILEFLSRYLENRMVLNVNGEKDPVFKTSWMPRKIIADLLLLENQLPWCVLDCLFNHMPSLKTTHQWCSRLDDLVSFSFSEYKTFPAAHSARSHEKHAHLLDCFRNCLVGSCTVKRRNYSEALEGKPVLLPVTELILHGIIHLKAKSRDNILDIKFKNGLMEIPEIVIEENTESVFRNLIAFEHCDPAKGYEITSYAALLDCLIKSPADALKLEQEGILRIIGLSNGDRASFLNRLLYNNDTSFHGFVYSDLCRDVNNFCFTRLGLWKARIRHDYFGEPWQVITFLFGILASFLFSLVQTVFAVASYKDSNF
ncbi:UPF0481 protein At3g47200-like [Carya illinoinensis]|uniref:Uncharacterized protein n=1 Tax=Carya illinoinensis TaxID=32201 RepID=A0A8T1NVD6_CARIL|nr:UPF0481 protein At3g47200-like [Carya illinoinensis]KAG6633322.1 hypothetical protein CIPAW_12G041100 [Carya illinoinensis]